MSLIIGLNAVHPDSSACALKDGRLVAAVAEESRLSELFHGDILPQHERAGNHR
jgi:predicted NodU family carbamoyl transferase